MTDLPPWRHRHGSRPYPAALDHVDFPAMSDWVDTAGTDRVDVLRSLLHMSQAVLCARYFDEVLEAIAHHTLSALDAASVSISRWERDEDVLRTLINVGKLGPGEEPWPENETYPVDNDRRIIRLLRQGLPYIYSIDAEHPDTSSLLYTVEKESEVAVPVMHNDVMWGELYVTGTDGRRFGADDVQILQAIAAHMAVAVGRSQLFSTVWRQAFEDPLTGLANRRGLDQAFADMTIEEVRPALLVCDLDGFKEVNDERGHPAGDALLCTVADALAATAAPLPGSLVARLGGDEFCVVLPRAGLDDAETFAVTASRAIIELAGEPVSVSWGAAVSGALVPDGPSLVAAADTALLQSKRLGPGRFSTGIADDNPVPAGGLRGRRAFPGEVIVPDLVGHITGLLDQYQPRTPAEALQILAVQVCNVTGAAAWSLSVVTEDGQGVRGYRGVESARDGVSGLRVLAAPQDMVFPLADYPATARALATGVPFLAAVDLPESDPAEVALLDELGYRAVLVATAGDGVTRYIVEIYSDTGHAELAAIAPQVRVLAQFCCTPRPV
jgi:diguanylate cyclase (GGDEF)-like protein